MHKRSQGLLHIRFLAINVAALAMLAHWSYICLPIRDSESADRAPSREVCIADPQIVQTGSAPWDNKMAVYRFEKLIKVAKLIASNMHINIILAIKLYWRQVSDVVFLHCEVGSYFRPLCRGGCSLFGRLCVVKKVRKRCTSSVESSLVLVTFQALPGLQAPDRRCQGSCLYLNADVRSARVNMPDHQATSLQSFLLTETDSLHYVESHKTDDLHYVLRHTFVGYNTAKLCCSSGQLTH